MLVAFDPSRNRFGYWPWVMLGPQCACRMGRFPPLGPCPPSVPRGECSGFEQPQPMTWSRTCLPALVGLKDNLNQEAIEELHWFGGLLSVEFRSKRLAHSLHLHIQEIGLG